MTGDNEEATVQDDEEGSLEDRGGPARPSPRLHQSLTGQGIDGFQDPSCDTTVCHTSPSETSSNRYPVRVSDASGCSTAVCHNGPEPQKRLPQPSGRSRPPSSAPSRRQPLGLIVRGRVFYLRIRVPCALVEKVGKTHWVRSLGTGSRGEAVRRGRIAAADFERLLMQAEARSHHADHRPGVPPKRPALPIRPEKTFRDLFDFFMADPSRTRARKTDMVYETLFEMAAALWGADRPLRAIDREACRDLLDLLRWLPSNPTKRFPKLTAVQAAKMAKAKGMTSTLSPASVNGYLNKLRAMLNFAVREELIDRNPAKGLRVADPVRSRDKRSPFSTEQLRLIFSAPLYTGCVDDWLGYAVPGTNRPRRGRFWVPLIGLFAGLRLNEACQLDVADIQVVDALDCILVSEGAAAPGNDKKLKTMSSERYIPIHPILREIGFLEFVAERRLTGGKKLFPELQMSSTGYYSDPFSKWFRRFLDKAGASRPKTCFHSFRHCYRDALREARIDHDIGLALGGWTSAGGKEGTETAASYGQGYRLATLAQAMTQIEYRGLDLTHLIYRDTRARAR